MFLLGLCEELKLLRESCVIIFFLGGGEVNGFFCPFPFENPIQFGVSQAFTVRGPLTTTLNTSFKGAGAELG